MTEVAQISKKTNTVPAYMNNYKQFSVAYIYWCENYNFEVNV